MTQRQFEIGRDPFFCHRLHDILLVPGYCGSDDGAARCVPKVARCKEDDPMRADRAAVKEYSGGDDNSRFYSAFAEAWRKATTIGQRNLAPLEPNCDIEYW